MTNGSYSKILIVDDDQTFLDLLDVYLRDCYYEVIQADGGQLALELFQTEKPDMVLLDLHMPEINGIKVLKVITKESPDTPVVVVSGMSGQDDALEAIRLGAWDYVLKPICDMSILEHSMNKAFARSEQIRQKKLYQEQLEEQIREYGRMSEERMINIVDSNKQLKHELREKRAAEAVLSKRVKYVRGLVDCLKIIQKEGDSEILLNTFVELIRQILRIDRIAIFENISETGSDLFSRLRAESFAEGEYSFEENESFALFSYDNGFQRWKDRLSANETIYGFADEFSNTESNQLRQRNIESFILAPLFAGDEWSGFIGAFDHNRKRTWTQDDIYLIENCAEMIGNIIKKAEKSESESESGKNIYKVLVDSSPDAILLMELDGKVILSNPHGARIFGYENVDQFLSSERRVFDHYISEDRERGLENLDIIRETGFLSNIKYTVEKSEDELIPIEMSISLITNPAGEPANFIGIGRDISARISVEKQEGVQQQQLIQANKMVALGTLVSGVAHEINNPNNFIMLNAPQLADSWRSIEPMLEEYYRSNGDFLVGGLKYTRMKGVVPKLFDGIVEGADRIKNIVADLKNFARKNTSEMTDSVEVNSVLKSAISLINNMIKKSTDYFSVEYGSEIPTFTGNSQQLEQVLINLIQNSCQALENRNRKISVKSFYDAKQEEVQLSVSDEGKGIDKKTLEHIFDPFFTTKRETGGTGLGLSISSRIIKDHDGILTMNSMPGQGTTASIIISTRSKSDSVNPE